jgi:hypothetical protein
MQLNIACSALSKLLSVIHPKLQIAKIPLLEDLKMLIPQFPLMKKRNLNFYRKKQLYYWDSFFVKA